MLQYANWNETVLLNGKSFAAEIVDDFYAKSAGFARIYAVNGLPDPFIDQLVIASQVSDVPHTWRIRECQAESEVTIDIIERGREALRRDIAEMGVHVIAYVGDADGLGKNLVFLAAGAIRDKLTRSYQNEEFPVISRAIVAPSYRGKKLGSLIVEHRMKCVIHGFFKKKPKAIHFGTESKKVLQSIKRVEKDEGIKFVYIGDEMYEVAGVTYKVNDFLCYLPWYSQSLLQACDKLEKQTAVQNIKEFKENLNTFLLRGVEGVKGQYLEELFGKVKLSLEPINNRSAEVADAINLLEEVFFIRKKIGAEDPIN
jgi:GNAT superfamily N-acetyltransferase